MLKWVTARQYSKETGMNYAEVLRQCKKGGLNCKKTDGGNFYVAIENIENAISNENIMNELKELKAALAYQTIIIQNLSNK